MLLVGGGLANGLIAYRLAQTRPEVSFRVVEAGPRLGGQHTWSFFQSDLDAEGQWVLPLVSRSWDHYEVRFPKRQRRVSNGYRSITSEKFSAMVGAMLGDRVLLDAPVSSIDLEGVDLANGERLSADIVIDGRGPGEFPDLTLGYQKFLGQTVRLAADHGLEGPIIMDATVDQKGGYRFVYVLPWDKRTVLIEDTRYTDHHDLNLADFRAGVVSYAASQGWSIEEVLGEEQGVLPVALEGDIDAHWQRAAGQAMSGLRAALFHPTTGYSLPDAVRLANSICKLPEINRVTVERLIREHSISTWKRRGFFRLLNRMLFRAAQPEERYRVLQRFYGLREPLMARFYAGRLTHFDKARIVTGVPPVPFFAGVRCIPERTVS
jgi:lycopene beta-cyclase